MEKVRRQHYVPRMYLKRFGYGNIGDEYISVLKLDNGTVLDNRKVENFAVANYFYDADKEQIAEILKEDLKVFPELCDNEKLSDEQFTEHALAREESAISKMLNELQEDLSRIHISSNRNLMVIFLHSLAYRTKQFRDQMDAINNKTEKCLMNALKRSLKKSNLRLEMKTFHYCIRRLKMLHLGQANCIYMLRLFISLCTILRFAYSSVPPWLGGLRYMHSTSSNARDTFESSHLPFDATNLDRRLSQNSIL